MKLVIDLPEEIYRAYKMDVTLSSLNEDQRSYAKWYLINGLVNGTPLSQEPCDDAISRQAAIDAFERFIHELGINDEPYNYGEMALSPQNVPPVTPVENWAKDYKQFYITEGKYFMSLYPTKESCPNDFIKEAWDIWYEFLENIMEVEE